MVIYFDKDSGNVPDYLDEIVHNGSRYAFDDPYMFSVAMNKAKKEGLLTIGYKTVIKGRYDIDYYNYPITLDQIKSEGEF